MRRGGETSADSRDEAEGVRLVVGVVVALVAVVAAVVGAVVAAVVAAAVLAAVATAMPSSLASRPPTSSSSVVSARQWTVTGSRSNTRTAICAPLTP